MHARNHSCYDSLLMDFNTGHFQRVKVCCDRANKGHCYCQRVSLFNNRASNYNELITRNVIRKSRSKLRYPT